MLKLSDNQIDAIRNSELSVKLADYLKDARYRARTVRRRMQSSTIEIAIRQYFDRCPRTGQEYQLIDRLVRKGRRFFLIEGPKLGGREVVRPISLKYAFR